MSPIKRRRHRLRKETGEDAVAPARGCRGDVTPFCSGGRVRFAPERKSSFRTGEDEPGRLHRRGRDRKTAPESRTKEAKQIA
jgi:hypothetical protein